MDITLINYLNHTEKLLNIITNYMKSILQKKKKLLYYMTALCIMSNNK